ncbi:inosine triphosphate pyrophosphatase-like [Hyposmocoma kahamanoa]|uniref:inosine triphosphate pyrophosphatase-like n=1 Tax=Hyposmocoma kahamanoa TaxID=1477025 RepID=UPI000E6D6B5C|nr:inosine triphosphate pyrophosphatase-like [Hyposmocoma kahamanoa]
MYVYFTKTLKPKLTFVTGNKMKLKEVQAILGPNSPVEIVSYNLDLPELQGEIEDIIVKKCQEAARRLRLPVLVEDTSLCFNALEGLPGPYIKWFIKKLQPEGLVRLLAGWDDKSAEAISTFGFCKGDCEDSKVEIFQGRTQGTIVNPKVQNYHGWETCWDCVFQPNGYNKTYAELEIEEKNRISQRFKALMKLKARFSQMDL